MAELTKQELYERWRDRWDNFLTLISNTETSDEARNALRDKVIIGNAERKIAGGHEGREILELLQNARDAIWSGDAESGRVHVGIYDQGVLVANTGSRFDLFDPQVEDAVTMIGETGKGGDENQSIGHKGVGLKSILATGDSFEIFTRPEKQTDDILGIRLSRSYLVQALLNRLGHDTDSDSSSIGDIDDSGFKQLLSENARSSPVTIGHKLEETIAKLPLFNFPVPLAMDGSFSDPIRARVQQLLTGQPSAESKEPYRTAVFIRYEDAEWRSQLADLGVTPPSEDDEDERLVEKRPKRIWEYLSAGDSEDGLQAETLVQLGGIDELHLERAAGPQGQTVAEERWEIVQTQSADTTTPELSHDEVEVRINTTESNDIVRRFDQFEFMDPRQYYTTLLVNKSLDEGSPPIKSYPLYLFYPIENTDDVELPFCLHGRFRVETNRKDLSANNFETNYQVLTEAIELIELVGEEVGRTNASSEASIYSDHLPWILLPPVPDSDGIDEPSSDEDLIEWFQQGLLTRLAGTACMPTPGGPQKPAETLLHWDEDVIEGYVAYRSILAELDRKTESIETRPIPADTVLRAALEMPSWGKRIKSLLRTDDERKTSYGVLDGWITHLDHSLSIGQGESPAVTVSASSARSFLEGTVSLMTAATDGDGSLDEVLTDFSDQFDGIYHLPCKIRDVDPDERLALVSLESRQTPTGGDVNQRRIRSVIWDIGSSAQDIDRPPIPPQSANMTVYFLDEAIQTIPGVHHVLSVAGRAWGLRAYEGMPSFVRSLLDTFADGRHETVKPIDFAFLAAIVDRLGDESSDLQTGEGKFFPREYLRTAITQQEGDQRANLRRRVQLRTCNLHLHKDETRPLAETVLGDGWQLIHEREQQIDNEEGDREDITAEWEQIEPDEYPAATWPEPEAPTWDVFREQINRDVTEFDFAQTLSLLGTATLPGIRVLWMYGDDHPSMRQSRHWNPSEWTSNDFVETIPETVHSLHAALDEMPDYLSLLTSPDYHPQTSADHSSKCPVKTSGELNQVNLSSWVWIEDIEQLTNHGATVRELLRRHGDSLDETILQTGWSCNRGHKRRAWEETVPTLFNWQLRKLDIWEPVVDVDDELKPEWDEQASRLRYAVRIESRRGPQAARMFPHIDDEPRFSDRVLSTLGVRPVDELGVTGATDRLQKLQAVLVDGSLPADGTSRLWIPGERINDWNQAYTQLLQPVLKTLPENPDENITPDWGSLTHLLLRDGDQWVTASIEWIRENTDQIRYYQDQSPKPWETQEVEEEDYYILPRTAGGPFKRLATALGVEQLQASKLVFDLEDDDLEIVTDRYSDAITSFQSILTERRDLLVASTERSDEEEITAAADKLSTAVSNLAVAESFPKSALQQLSDPASALYAAENGQEALILNAAESNESLSLDALAMGLSLLVESPTKVATFREALRDDVSVEELETRWTKRTFPIETVKRVLGSNVLRSMERDLSALNELLDRLEESTVDTEPALAALEDADTDTFATVREWLQTGEDPTTGGNDASEIDPAIKQLAMSFREALPQELSFVASGLFSETVTHWVHELETQSITDDLAVVIIEWLADHRDALERPPFDQQARTKYNRLRTVTELWEQTDTDELAEIDVWAERLRELHSNTPPAWTDTLPEEYTDQLACPPFVVHVSIDNRVKSLVDEFCNDIESELPDIDFDWRGLIEEYIESGTVPERETETGAKDHQQRAFADLAVALNSGSRDTTIVSGEVDPENILNQEGTSVTVSSGSGSGGGSTQYRGRGQQGEAYVMADILDRVATWLTEYSGSDLIQFRRRFKRLYRNQKDADYQWHVKNVWTSDLQPLLENPDGIDRVSVTDWRSKVADGVVFTELPVIQLINVTMERGPGFDVIDPLGPISTDHGQDDFGLWFAPIEIKAVDGTSRPFNFRLTTNEYRQAKAFVRDNIPYVIRLVSVPDTNTVDWPEKTKVVAEEVMETESELEDVVGDQQFEQIVKGGYMNMQIE